MSAQGLIAGGIGVTAIRALLEDLPRATRPLVILRVSRDEDAVLKEELAELLLASAAGSCM